jgi:exopolysaccharide biosynthesis polyprenyl glycosylphosphotransferase
MYQEVRTRLSITTTGRPFMEKLQVDSNTDNSYFPELDNENPKAASAHARGTAFPLRFDHLITAAEIVSDFVAAAAGVIGAYGAYHALGLGKGVSYPIPIVLGAGAAFALLFVILLDREGVYRRGSGMLRISETERTLRVAAQTFLLLLVVTVFSAQLLSRWVLGIGIFLVPITVVIEKQVLFSIVRFLHERGQGVRKALVYGSGYTGKRVFSVLLRSRKLGINPVVFVDDNEEQVGKAIYALAYHRELCAPVISGPITSQLIDSYGVDMIIVAIPSLQPEKLHSLAAEAKKSGITLAFVPSYSAYEDAWVNYVDVDGIMLATVDPPERMYLYERTKRLLDIVFSIANLVLLFPVFALIALLVRLDSAGPVLFKQQRIGKHGRKFEIYKFRTMRVDTSKYEFSPTTSEDSRITRIGRILRKLSLDELPQIVNVIKGDMSLVGPRPEMPFIVDSYGPRERWRLSVVPGITGLWQLSADRAYLIHENLQYDLYYIRNRGFFMDIAILLHTLLFAVKGV